MPRLTDTFLILAMIGSTLLFTFLPSQYKVRVLYEIKGETFGLTQIPQEIEERGRKDGVSFKCRAGISFSQVICEKEGLKRTEAQPLAKYLQNKVPTYFGWISWEEYKERILDYQSKVTTRNKDLAEVQKQFSVVDRKTEKLFQSVVKRRRTLDQEKKDLEQKKSQLEMIDEGLAKKDSRVSLLSKKKKILLAEIPSLEKKIQQEDRRLQIDSTPLEERDRLMKLKNSIQDEIASLNSKITHMNETGQNEDKTLMIDPESFRLTQKKGLKVVLSSYSFFTLLWAPWIGLLLYLAIWRPQFALATPNETFLNVEEVIKETGLKLKLKI